MGSIGVGTNYGYDVPSLPGQQLDPRYAKPLGQMVEDIGSMLRLPEGNISEAIAGGPTRKTLGVYAADKYPNSGVQNGPFLDQSKVNTGSPSSGNSGGSYNFNIGDFENYRGWDQQSAYNDWIAKGRPMPGGGSGGGDPYAGLRNEIYSGYDTYIDRLNEMMGGLSGQAEGMNQIVENQYQSGADTLQNQQTQGLSDLQTEREQATANQAKNLKDLSENIRNMFMSGNVYLGSRGAGDSSAANQYAYALTKMGNKARGDVVSQTSQIQAEIGKRETSLKNTVATELRNLGRERDNKVLEVSQWLGEQQNALRDRIGQAGLSKSTDLANLSKGLLDQALQRLATAEQDIRNRRGMLEEWAVNQSKSIGELKNNLSAVASFNPQLPSVAQFSGTPTVSGGNYSLPINWSTNAQSEEKNIFGNPIRR